MGMTDKWSGSRRGRRRNPARCDGAPRRKEDASVSQQPARLGLPGWRGFRRTCSPQWIRLRWICPSTRQRFRSSTNRVWLWTRALVIARIAAAFHRIRPGSGCPCVPRRDWPERLSVRIEACRLPGLDCLLETGARNGLRGRRCRTALC